MNLNLDIGIICEKCDDNNYSGKPSFMCLVGSLFVNVEKKIQSQEYKCKTCDSHIRVVVYQK